MNDMVSERYGIFLLFFSPSFFSLVVIFSIVNFPSSAYLNKTKFVDTDVVRETENVTTS